MRWIDLLRMSSNSLKRRKLRTFLTVLGVVIGTASIVVMISLGLGLQESMYQEIEQSGGVTSLTVTGKGSSQMGGFYMWKLDVVSSLGVAVAFVVQVLLLHTKLHFLTPYIDPAVAAVMAILLIREPVVVIFQSIKNLVLFAPEEEVLNQIRSIVDKHMKDYPYEVTFLDVIQTGRKIWVEVYIGNQTDVIHISILHQVRDEIKQELKHKYDQVYIEIIPD